MRIEAPAEMQRALRDRGARQRLGRQARRRDHVDAVHGACGHAKLATVAVRGDDRVHALARADDGVGRAGLEAARAADAGGLVDPGDARRRLEPAGRVEGHGGAVEQRRELVDQRGAARRAAIERGLAAGERLCVGTAGVEAAAAALGLRQERIDARGEGLRVAGHMAALS